MMTLRFSMLSRRSSSRAQRGVVLVVALIFLLLLTMLAISASGRSLLQERMAGGLRNNQMAEMAAETALRGAEWKLWKAGGQGGVSCGSSVVTDCYVFDAANPINNVVQFRTSAGWVTAGSTEYKGEAGAHDYTSPSSNGFSSDQKLVAALALNPRYLIEDLGPELPPGAGGQHESGVTSSAGTGASNPGTHIYRITARGVGGNENAVRVLESTFGAKSN
jgi:type IV pilus assembly protein PilX